MLNYFFFFFSAVQQVWIISDSYNIWVLFCGNCLDRPGFNRYHFCPDWLVFFYVDGPVHNVVPDRWVVGSIHHVDLDLDTPRQRRISLILGSSFQLVRLALHLPQCNHTRGGNTKYNNNTYFFFLNIMLFNFFLT